MNDSEERTQFDDPEQKLAEESRLRYKILLGADRWLLVGGLAAGVFVGLVLIGLSVPVPVTRLLGYQDPVDTVFQGLISAVITGVTLVLTINQLILSQELGPIEDHRDRMQGALNFRQDIEEATGLAVAPSQPAVFLCALLEATRRKAIALGDTVDDAVAEDVRLEIENYADDISADAETVRDRLEDAQFGQRRFLRAILQFNYSLKIHDGRRIQNVYSAEDSLPDDTDEALDELLEVMQFFAPMRQYMKNLHFQWALIDLSRAILYAAVPALLVTFVMILFFDPEEVPGVTFGVLDQLWIVSGALTIAILPFLTLLAYLLRIGTVAKRTLAIGPFVLQPTAGDEEIEWEDGIE